MGFNSIDHFKSFLFRYDIATDFLPINLFEQSLFEDAAEKVALDCGTRRGGLNTGSFGADGQGPLGGVEYFCCEFRQWENRLDTCSLEVTHSASGDFMQALGTPFFVQWFGVSAQKWPAPPGCGNNFHIFVGIFLLF